MQSNWKTEVHQDKDDSRLELGYENANETSLEDVRVEEEQKDDDDGKQNAHILNSGTIMQTVFHTTWRNSWKKKLHITEVSLIDFGKPHTKILVTSIYVAVD